MADDPHARPGGAPPGAGPAPGDESARSGRRRETVGRILGAARRAIGRSGFSGATLGAVAKEAGVSKGLLHYHFESKDHLLVETQRAFFRQLHERFSERAQRGEGGLPSALEALDAMWESVRELHGGAPFVVETLALSSHDSPLGTKVSAFYDESTALLQDAIQLVFAQELDQLAVPPERMAVLIRVLLEGLVVELARARDEAALARVDAAYHDFRALFERFVLAGKDGPPVDLAALGPVPLPW